MGKQCVFICLFLLANLFCHSQKRSSRLVESEDASKYKPFTTTLEGKKKFSTPTHFKYALVMDQRADKSKMGIARAGDKPQNRRIVFPKELTSYLQEKMIKLCQNHSPTADTVVYVVNNVWVYQTLSEGSFMKQQLLAVSNNWITNCFLNIDCYLIRNKIYSWLCKVDTTLSTRGWLANQCNYILSEAFAAAVSFSDSIYSGNKNFEFAITGDQFAELQERKFNYPILLAQKPSQGVYNTYKDFLANGPNPVETEIYYQKNKRFLKSGNVADSVIQMSWGFSDGENAFINIGGSFFKLVRSENAFDLMGPYIVDYKLSVFNKVSATAASYALTKPIVDASAFLEPGHHSVETFKFYQLNITDGTLR